MTRKATLAYSIICGLILAAVPAIGQDNQPIKQTDPNIAPAQEVVEVGEISTTSQKLNRAVDLWHDANLKGDVRKSNEYERMIFDLLMADIRFLRSQIDVATRRVPEKEIDTLTLRRQQENLKKNAGFLRAKERLVSSLRKAEAFSNKYRLYGDYLQVLKIERRRNSIQLASKMEGSDTEAKSHQN